MTLGIVLVFLAVATLVYVTPGPDWFVVMRHATTSRRDGWLVVVDRVTGIAVVGLGGVPALSGRRAA